MAAKLSRQHYPDSIITLSDGVRQKVDDTATYFVLHPLTKSKIPFTLYHLPVY